MFNICMWNLIHTTPVPVNGFGLILLDRATERNMTANKEAAKNKLRMPVLAVGSQAFIGKEVKNQMDKVADNVQYQELKFGHQLAEECPHELARTYLDFLQKL